MTRQYGAKNIFVSSVIMTRVYQYRDVVAELNDFLYMACIAEGFLYMSQDDIELALKLGSDGIHLNSYGNTILKFNIVCVSYFWY